MQKLLKAHFFNEDEALVVLNRKLKKCREVVPEYEKAGQEQLVAELKHEIEILKGYLLPQLTEEGLRQITNKTITEVDAHVKSDWGKVMRIIIPKVRGKTNGSLAKQIVQELLD